MRTRDTFVIVVALTEFSIGALTGLGPPTRLVGALFVAALACVPQTAFAQTLPEVAREHGGTAGSLIDIDAPVARVPALLGDSDLVLHGRIAEVTNKLDREQANVVTQYVIAPIQAFKQRQVLTVSTPGAVAQIVVQHTGGTLLTADGLRLYTSVNIFPEAECFTRGEEVVVFLTFRSDIGVYRFTGGDFGAFRVRDGMVTPMTKRAQMRRDDDPVPARIFVADLKR